DPLEVEETPYKLDYSDSLQVIGHDWKYFDFNLGWVLDDSTAYFIKTKDSDKYKVVFLEFAGSGTGTATFLQEFLGNTSSVQNSGFSPSVHIFPNPASDFLTVNYDSENTLQVRIHSMDGKLLQSTTASSGTPVDIRQINYRGAAVISLENQGHVTTIPFVLK